MNKLYPHLRAIAAAVMLILSAACSAQLDEMYVSELSTGEQLPVDEITFITQDSEGYMWYGTTDGLCRDDGYNIKTFRSDFNTPGLIGRNHINYIAEGDSTHLWFSTTKGVYILDKKNYSIRRVDVDDIPQREISLLLRSRDGYVWLGGSAALYQFRPDGQLVKKRKLGHDVASMYEDTHGNLFVGVYAEGLYCRPTRIDDLRMVRKGLVPTCMTEDLVNGGYWVCEHGIFHFTCNPQAEGSATSLTPIKNPLDGHREVTFFTRICQAEKSHVIWLLSYYCGIIALDAQGNQIELPDFMQAKNNNNMNCLYIDRGGNIWTAGFNVGCNIICKKRDGVKNISLTDMKVNPGSIPSVTQLVKDNGGAFWISQNREGLYIYNPSTHETAFHYNDPQLKTHPLYQIKNIIKSGDHNTVWISFYGNRLLKLSRDGMQFKTIKYVDLSTFNLTANAITCLQEDKQGNLWIGTTDGLFKYLNAQGRIEATAVKTGEVSGIAIAADGDIWVGLCDNGIRRISRQGKLQSFMEQTDISSIGLSGDKTLWVATGNGNVFKYDYENNRAEDFTARLGLSGNKINDILADGNGHVWVFSNQSVSELDVRTGALHTISTSNENIALRRILPHSLYYSGKEKKIYIGGIPCIMSVDAESKTGSATRRRVVITDVKVANSSIWFDSLRHESDRYIELGPDNPNVEISFSSLDLLHARTNHYAYRLPGIQDEWIYLDAGKNKATFNNLPKGEFKFQVKAVNDNGVWDNNYTELIIRRLPAWYETAFAYICYAILVITLIGYVIHRYQQRTKQKNEKRIAEQLIQTKLRYFTNISHELLTPLAVISSINESIEPSDDAQAKKLLLIKSNISRLKHLLQQILDFRKVETQNIRLYVEKGNISKFVERICKESFIPLAQGKNIRINIDKPIEDITGYFDTDKIEKVLFNLVSNAIKYSDEGKKITIKMDLKPGDRVTIAVKDEGIGIEQKELNRIFRRFYSSRFNDASQSNGIGLSLTKDLIEYHHGKISVSSQRGKGSTFTIEFPIGRDAYTPLEIKDKTNEEQISMLKKEISDMETDQHPATDHSVLIVEDNVEMLSALQELLSKRYYTYTATNGEEALSVVSQHPELQFVVSDISMPVMDGIELCRRLKNDINTSHIIVVMLTAMISSEKQVESYDAGADAYIPKPFESKVLNALLVNLWTQREKRQKAFHDNPDESASITELEVNRLDKEFLDKAMETVNRNMSSETFDVEKLASELCMSRSTLSRKLKALTGETPAEFIKSLKMKHAYRLLKSNNYQVIEIMFEVGYNDRHSFTQAFKNQFGILPSKIQEQN
jgi:signal transduction histidine kinase/ligand-binding sensor domain-containing protein/DNA-binding response OmpR family regulator